MRLEGALTELLISGSPVRVGRRKQWAEDMQARFAEGTFERIAPLLGPGEDRTDFVREAVDREIKRRERRQPTARPAEPAGSEGDEGDRDGDAIYRPG